MTFTANSWRNKLFWSFPSAFALFLALIPSFAQNCWKVEQHCMPVGDCVIYLSPVALRIDCLRTGSTVLAKAPTWQVSFFNKGTHRITKMSLQNWHGAPISRTVELWFDTKPSAKWTSAGQVTYRKFSCEYILSDARTIKVYLTKQKVSPDEMWRSSELKLTPEQGDILCKLYGVARLANRNSAKPDGMPLFLTLRKAADVRAEFLQTQSYKQVASANLFELPNGFKPVADDVKVEEGKAAFFMPFKP